MKKRISYISILMLCTAMACVMAAVAQPNIDLLKNASPISGAPSTNVSFNILANNTGDARFNFVKIIDLLPAGLTFLTGTSQPPADNVSPNDDGTTTIIWDNVSPSGLNPGNSSLVTFQAHIDGVDTSGAKSYGNKTNYAAVQAATEQGNISSASALTTIQALNAEIRATKRANKTSAAPGAYVGFILKITNTGNATLQPVQVADVLGRGLKYISSNTTAEATPDAVSWTFDQLLPDESIFISLVAQVEADASGTLVNTVAAMGQPENGEAVFNQSTTTITVIRPSRVRPISTNRDKIDLGKEVSQAFTASFFKKDAARATNDLEIKKNQDSGNCSACPDCDNACAKLNREEIRVGDRDAAAHGSGDSTNHVKLVSNQV